MTVVVSFLLLWGQSLRRGVDEVLFELATSAWRVFLWYSLLSIADFLMFHLFVVRHHAIMNIPWYAAWQGLLVIVFWFLVLASAAIVKARHQGKSSNSIHYQ